MTKDLGGVTEEQLPCPFCGELPEYVRAERDFATLDEALLADPDVRCRTPRCPMRFQPTALTLAEWNTRAAPAAVADGERYREVLIEARGELLRQQRGGDPDRKEHCRSAVEHIDRALAPEAAASDQGEG